MSTEVIRGLHLDLKYHMPRKTYLNEWVRQLPSFGIDTLLLEYEDKFPFRRYPFLRSPDAFSTDELVSFLAVARGAGLRVIPLIQSLSHLEFALAHEELAALREAPDIPTQICPSRPQAVAFVSDMIDEVLNAHAEDEFVHLGGDETWFLGTCPTCRDWKERVGVSGMWIEHETYLAERLRHAGKRVILWDDVLREHMDCGRPARIGQAGKPDLLLHSWQYGVTDTKESAEGVALWKSVRELRSAGCEIVAGPCLNWGQLFPQLSHSLDNTRAWARQARVLGLRGLINTSWAVFHVPLQAQNLLIAATGALCRTPDADVGPGWQAEWLRREFGAPADGIPDALQTMGELWEIALPGVERPFAPLPYGYMNMVLHYPGGQDERRRRGSYPLDWNDVDFGVVYHKGVEAVRAHAAPSVFERLDLILERYPPAVAALEKFAHRATRMRDDAEVLAGLASFKLTSARVFNQLIRPSARRVEMNDELGRQRGVLERVLGLAYEPEGRARLLRTWWEPLREALVRSSGIGTRNSITNRTT